MKIKVKNNKLIKKELVFIAEAIIFTMSSDICIEWSDDKNNEFLEIIKYLNSKIGYIELPNIYLAKGTLLENDKLIRQIRKYFKLKIK